MEYRGLKNSLFARTVLVAAIFGWVAATVAPSMRFSHANVNASARAKVFSQTDEFPRFFVHRAFRHLSPEQIPVRALTEVRAHFDAAIASILRRTTVPIVLSGEHHPTAVRYFDFIQGELEKLLVSQGLKPEVQVLASGGVVRSAIGLLYFEAYNAMMAEPGLDTIDFLKKVAQATEPISSLKVRGVGSDWDVLLNGYPEGWLGALRAKVLEITNSAENKTGMGRTQTEEQDAIKRSVFSMADVKDYHQQTTRSTRQGGSTVDWLGFDVIRGHFVEPPDHLGIVDKLIRGWAEYLAPVEKSTPEDASLQTVRGARVFLELPFLKLKDTKVFEGDVAKIDQVSEKAMRQFPKMLRNSRFCGAHNRFYRAQARTPERLFFEKASQLLNRRDSAVIPEFTDHYPIAARKAADREELNGLPARLLTLVDEFVSDPRLSNQGHVFHGTPSVENGIAIIRQGLFLSKPGQGFAAFGRGAYASPDRSVARSYAGLRGIAFELAIKQDRRINILDWDKHQNDPWILDLQKRAAREGREPFEVLARDHGIDVVIHHHVLIQNADAFEFPRHLGGLIDGFAQSLNRAWEEGAGKKGNWSDQLNQYMRLHEYGVAMGEPHLRAPGEVVQDLLQSASPERRKDFFSSTYDMPWTLRETLSRSLEWALADPSPEVRLSAATWFLTGGKSPRMEQLAGPVILETLDGKTVRSSVDGLLRRVLPESPLAKPLLEKMEELGLKVPRETLVWLIDQDFAEESIKPWVATILGGANVPSIESVAARTEDIVSGIADQFRFASGRRHFSPGVSRLIEEADKLRRTTAAESAFRSKLLSGSAFVRIWMKDLGPSGKPAPNAYHLILPKWLTEEPVSYRGLFEAAKKSADPEATMAWLMKNAPKTNRTLVEDLTLPGLSSPNDELRHEAALWHWTGEGSARDRECEAILLQWSRELRDAAEGAVDGRRILELATHAIPPLEELILERRLGLLEAQHILNLLQDPEKVSARVWDSIVAEALDTGEARPVPKWDLLKDLATRSKYSKQTLPAVVRETLRDGVRDHATRGDLEALKLHLLWIKSEQPTGEALGKMLDPLLQYWKVHRRDRRGAGVEQSADLNWEIRFGEGIKDFAKDVKAVEYVYRKLGSDPDIASLLADKVSQSYRADAGGLPEVMREVILRELERSQVWEHREGLIRYLESSGDFSAPSVEAVEKAARDYIEARLPPAVDPSVPVYPILRYLGSTSTQEASAFEIANRVIGSPDSRDSLAAALHFLGRNKSPDRTVYERVADWLFRVARDARRQEMPPLPGQDRYENIAMWEFSRRRFAMDGRQYSQVAEAASFALRAAPEVIEARRSELQDAVAAFPEYLQKTEWARSLRATLQVSRAVSARADESSAALLTTRTADVELVGVARPEADQRALASTSGNPCATKAGRRAWWRRIFFGD